MSERVEVEVQGQTVKRRGRSGLLGTLFFLPGLSFIGFGVALIVWPTLLIYLVAAVFIAIGVGLLIAARKIGRVRTKAAEFRARFSGPM